MQLPTRIPSPNMKLSLPRRRGAEVVGLDIQPGFVAAVKARVNGSIVAERAVSAPLAPDTMRDGEVLDGDALGDVLRDLFNESGMGKRVRVGVANQRTVLRILELPPVTDQKELAAAVSFQAQEQVPMPLSNAVLDFHPLGIVETPAGPRQRVVLVAAQRDMVERLLAAVRRAGLTAEGVDLSAFALIRSLYRTGSDDAGRVLYLNVDGLTNLAIAEGPVCRFTRVVGSGLEGMAIELAERRSIALEEARSLLAGVDLSAPAMVELPAAEPEPLVGEPQQHPDGPQQNPDESVHEAGEAPAGRTPAGREAPASSQALRDEERAMSYEQQLAAVASPPAGDPPPESHAEPISDLDLVSVIEDGIREISGEVRNSLDFHRSQEGGGEVSHVVLSGSAEDIPGFAEALQASLGVEVRRAEIGVNDAGIGEAVAPHRLAVATGLAAMEVSQ